MADVHEPQAEANFPESTTEPEQQLLPEKVEPLVSETPLPAPPPPMEEKEEEREKEKEQEAVILEAEKEKPGEEKEKEKSFPPRSLISFKEESNLVADLSDSEIKALKELKGLIQDALKTWAKSDKTPETGEAQVESKAEEAEEVSMWGIPLLKDDRSDVILLKFLRARDFQVKESFTMFNNTMKWRKEFGVDGLLDEDLGDDLEKVVFNHGFDREGHPVCYNVYGEFQNKDLYSRTFSNEEKRMKFLRWRIQFLERSVRKLDFRPGGISTVFQVNDLRNLVGVGKRGHWIAMKQAVHLVQDNYPEFVAKQAVINCPWWYLAYYKMLSPFITQRSKSKFVFSGPSRMAETLFKYISPEHVPVQYGGLSVDYCDCNPEFTIADPVTDIAVKPGTKQTVEIIIYERCVIVWELRAVGWEVSYSAEFVPETEDSYAIIIQKATKMAPNDEPVVCKRFKVNELGKLLLTIDNPTSKKKTLLYRYKINPLSD